MNEILKNIFEEENFEIKRFDVEERIDSNYIDFQKSFFCLSKKERKKSEYYLVVFLDKPDCENLNDLIENKSDEFFVEIQYMDCYTGEMDKNTSLLVCIELEDLNINKNFKKKIFDIEEDQYDFKKYVLTYTKKQLKLLKNKYRNEDIKLINYLNLIINNNDLFKEFKLNPKKETEYNLVSKLLIKLPFLILKNNSDKKLKNLSKKIQEKLKGNDLKELAEKILDIEENEDLENIKSVLLSEEASDGI